MGKGNTSKSSNPSNSGKKVENQKSTSKSKNTPLPAQKDTLKKKKIDDIDEIFQKKGKEAQASTFLQSKFIRRSN
jgi:hypothetical protein